MFTSEYKDSFGFNPKGTAFVVFTEGDAVLSKILKSIGSFPTYS